MNKCSLCQQINNLIIVYNTKLKYLAKIILRLKGYKDTLDIDEYLAICEKCNRGLKNVSELWENIPEAGEQDKEVESLELEKEEPNEEVNSNEVSTNVPGENLQLLKTERQISSKEETYYEPIKIRIKLPQKKRKKPKTNSDNLVLNNEIINAKRLRRPPKRYEDFKTNTITQLQEQRNSSNVSLENVAEIAFLRFPNGLEVGKLVEVESNGVTSRIRIICQKCLQIFRFEKEFKKHIKSHELITLKESLDIENYLYHCKLCDKSYREHYAVRRHYRIAHSEERPLKCEHCEASFKYKFNLDYHMAKHIPKKRFECVFCKKSFVLRYELQIHLRTHTKEKPYKCQFCTMAFAHRTNLKTHQKNKHFRDSKICTNSKETQINNTSTDENMKENKHLNNEMNISENRELLLNESIEEKTMLEEANNAEIPFPIDFENITNDLNDFNNTDLIEASQDLTNVIEESISIDMSNNNDKLLETDQNNTKDTQFTSNALERFNNPTNFGTFHLDKSILKVLPSSELLGLKKWPKSYQNPTFSKQNLDLKQINGSINNIDLENGSRKQNLDLENTSVMKYKPVEKNSNSTQITNINNLNNISKTTTSNEDSSHELIEKSLLKFKPETNENKPMTNFEVPSGSTLIKGGKFINITKLSSSSSLKKSAEQTTNKKTLKDKSIEDSKMKNNSQPWKVIKVSSRPVKIINLNKSKINLNSNNKINSPKTESLITKKTESYTENCTQNSSLKYTKPSGQSLLKPAIKSKQIPPVSLTNFLNNETNLSQKPLITNIEILPPLKSFAATTLPAAPQNLLKPPANYKYQCTYCWKYFKQKSPLTKHLRTHTGEKPYKCNLCPKSYADASNYKKHKILHKNAAEALNIECSTNPYAVPNSPAYSTVSDPDPDGIEIMQTIKKIESSSCMDDDDDGEEVDEVLYDNASMSSSTMESYMWQDALENALMNEDIRENIKRNLADLNNAIMPKSIQHLGGKTTKHFGSNNFSSEDPD